MILLLPFALMFLLTTSCSSLENTQITEQEIEHIYQRPGDVR